MSITPRGINILEAYTWYRKGQLLVNRRYQRKLVWTVEEKQKLIDSILLNYPLPLIFLAETKRSQYEVIDGLQRLNAVFSFIETGYSREDGRYFDLKEFPAAKEEGEKGSFQPKRPHFDTISRSDCIKLLGYQLAVTVFSAEDEQKINEIFSRINSSGRRLSGQERRQAGVTSGFSDLVRELSHEIRGDDSSAVLELFNMPMISIDTKRENHGYKISAEETFWCHHGILSTKQLRRSDDEEMTADIAASILLNRPFARSRKNLDKLYSDGSVGGSKEAETIETRLQQYGNKKIRAEIKSLFHLIDKTVKTCSKRRGFLKKRFWGDGKKSSESIKADFHALFLAFYELVVKEGKYPENSRAVLTALKGAHSTLKIPTKDAKPGERQKNIDKIKGLIQKFFVKKEPRQLLHGEGLTIDLENSFRRSKIETAHYEFKQGLLSLESPRTFNKNIIKKLAETACGMANISPNKEGYIHIGVADRLQHADKIKKTDSIVPKKVNGFYAVGIDREAKIQNKTLEQYVNFFVSEFKKTKLSEPLKSSVLKNMDIINYYGFSVIRLKIEPQFQVSYSDDQCFIREHSHTKRAVGPEQEKVTSLFNEAVAKKASVSSKNSSQKIREKSGKKK